jgi:DNA modification methylase
MPKDIASIEDLQPDAKNANRGTERGLGMVEDSLRQYGAGRSILVDKDGVVIAGNKTLEVAADLGLPVRVVRTDGRELVVVQREDLDLDDGDKARGLAYADNRSSEVGLDWDLERILADVEAGVDLDGLWGEDELRNLLKGVGPEPPADPGPQIDRAEELCEKWQTERGQVWQVGRHRLMCGDSTSEEDVGRLMEDDKANLVWTDPPYGVHYGDKLDAANPMGYRVRSIEGDDLPPAELEQFIRAAFTLAARATELGAAIYVACPPGTPLPTLIGAFAGSGFTFHWGLIWLKDQLVLGRGDYHFRHENILYGWKHDAGHYFTESRKHDSIFEVPRPRASEEHPTMKPPELVGRMIENSSKIGWGVYDCFLGSGTTMVAAEQLGRICYGMEIEPKYVAVTLERMAGMGLESQLIKS